MTRILILITAIFTVTATLLMPAEASASRFRWKLDQNGNWNDPSKWRLLAEANAVSNPRVLPPGQALIVPAIE